MSASPTPSPERHYMHGRPRSDHDRPQIRLVPYSPPRLSFDGSLSPLSTPNSSTDSHVDPISTSSKKVMNKPCRSLENIEIWSPDTVSLGIAQPARPVFLTNISDNAVQQASHSSLSASRTYFPPSSEPNLTEPLSLRCQPKFTSTHEDKYSLNIQSCSAFSATLSQKSHYESSITPTNAIRLSSSNVPQEEDSPGPHTTALSGKSSSQCKVVAPKASSSTSASISSWSRRIWRGLNTVHSHTSSNSQLFDSAMTSRPRVLKPLMTPRVRKIAPSKSSKSYWCSSKQPGQSARSKTSQSDGSRDMHSSGFSMVAAVNSAENTGIMFSDSHSHDFGHSNIEILGDSSSQSVGSCQFRDGEANYLVHGDKSSCSSMGLRSEFSRESLLVPPLRSRQQKSTEQPASAKPHRHDCTLKEPQSSGSSVMKKGNNSLMAGAKAKRTASRPSRPNLLRRGSNDYSSNTRWAMFRTPQWNPALPTVSLCSEVGSNINSSLLSDGCHSSSPDADAGAVSSVLSGRRRNRLSPTLTKDEQPVYPSTTHQRASSREIKYKSIRLPIRDQDEHGDGLADLESLNHHFSRSRLHSLLSSQSSDRNLQSSSSSRCGSFSRLSIPAWARVYYGSGERRLLSTKASSDSLCSQANRRSWGPSSFNRSPSAGRFPATVKNPRRRPLDISSLRISSGAILQDEINAVPLSITRSSWSSRQRTSSLWSPHLRRDKRANDHKIWESPSAVWSTSKSLISRRNLQPTLFVVGFLFPPAWAIASFLPLPSLSKSEMREEVSGAGHFNSWFMVRSPTDILDIRLYNHTRWWRTLNRAMSVIGIFIVGAVIALIVTGVRLKW